MLDLNNFFNRELSVSKLETRSINEEEKPDGRSNHGVVCYQKKIYLYGGRNSLTSRLNTLHCLDLSTNTWHLLKPTGCQVPRVSAFSLTLDPVNGKIYLLGGVDHMNESLNTLYEYSIGKNEWRKLPNCKYKFVDHAAVWYEGKLWAWGGEDFSDGRNPNSVFCFIPKTNQWKIITPKDQNLISSFLISITLVVCYDQMYVFGGNIDDDDLNCFYVFSFTHFKWRKIEDPNENSEEDEEDYEDENTNSSWPAKRMGHVAEVWGNKIIVSTGYSQMKNTYHEDLWIFDTISETWQQISIKKFLSTNNNENNNDNENNSNTQKFSGRIRSKIVRSDADNNYYIIGGYTDDYLIDVWKFSFQYSVLEMELTDFYTNCHELNNYPLLDNQNQKHFVNQNLIKSRINGHSIQELEKILKNYSPKIVRNILKFLYLGNFNWGELKIKHLVKLDQISQIFSLSIWHKTSDCSTIFLQDDIASLINDEHTKDFEIIVENKAIRVHKFILCLKSELYRGFFDYIGYHFTQIKDHSKRSYNAIKAFLYYIYTGSKEHINHQISDQLIGVSDYYGLNLQDDFEEFCLGYHDKIFSNQDTKKDNKKKRRRNSIGDVSEIYFNTNKEKK
ncbi:leucine-zipper-like transcriptional regulator [Anaeramoeba flamelloides]|uniref:Leucine-zipper-like transcriptional regulator n=1 Tax=Anaeramoeba flamelloides TaxID=1746091 RepID=A0AAV7YP47_9EUKA|nr:leucine-zipper-like transcriptional regulator [Anaeramoeba flamelloides]